MDGGSIPPSSTTLFAQLDGQFRLWISSTSTGLLPLVFARLRVRLVLGSAPPRTVVLFRAGARFDATPLHVAARSPGLLSRAGATFALSGSACRPHSSGPNETVDGEVWLVPTDVGAGRVDLVAADFATLVPAPSPLKPCQGRGDLGGEVSLGRATKPTASNNISITTPATMPPGIVSSMTSAGPTPSPARRSSHALGPRRCPPQPLAPGRRPRCRAAHLVRRADTSHPTTRSRHRPRTVRSLRGLGTVVYSWRTVA